MKLVGEGLLEKMELQECLVTERSLDQKEVQESLVKLVEEGLLEKMELQECLEYLSVKMSLTRYARNKAGSEHH